MNLPTFVKWAGGKSKLVDEYQKYIPKNFNRYFEPFVGGGAMFFFLKQKYPEKEFIISDLNPDLINAYKIVKNDVKSLISKLGEHKKEHDNDSKTYYYKIRDEINKNKLSDIEKAARFIYLNRTCFNGLYRVNSKGKFNVPIGRYKNPSIIRKKTLRKVNKILQNVEIKKQSFEKILSVVKKNDFVYFDPPYMPLSETSNFTGYGKNGFDEKDQSKLAQVFKKMDKKGVNLLLSNSNHPTIRELYNDFKIKEIMARRSINSKASKRGKIKEILVINE